MSVYSDLKTALEGIKPEGWKITAYEPLSELPDVTSLTMKVRSVRRLPAAPDGAYQVEWVLTVTSSVPSRETADPTLFDELIDFLIALDTEPDLSWLGWTGAEKTVGDDLERLAYDITLITHSSKDTPEEEEV